MLVLCHPSLTRGPTSEGLNQKAVRWFSFCERAGWGGERERQRERGGMDREKEAFSKKQGKIKCSQPALQLCNVLFFQSSCSAGFGKTVKVIHKLLICSTVVQCFFFFSSVHVLLVVEIQLNKEDLS